MRWFFISSFLLLTLTVIAQPIPFQVSFLKMYLGSYDPSGHKTTELTLSDLHHIDVTFDGKSSLVAVMYSRTNVDTLKIDHMRLETTSAGDDFVEYKYIADENFVVFLRYNRYYIAGISELSIFHPNMTKFFYIKRKKNGNKSNIPTTEANGGY